MVVAGLQKCSLIDFPGKVSAVVFITGCNFTCPYCHNPELARGRYPQRISRDELLDFLSHRRTLIDGVVITGGEPTLWPHLHGLCSAIGDLKLAVKLDTNGSRPDVLGHLIHDRLVDYVAMDIKTSLENYGPPFCDSTDAPKVKQSIRRIMESTVDYEFRTTCAPPFINDATLLQIAAEIRNARRYVLQAFRPRVVLDPDFIDASGPAGSKKQLSRFRSLVLPLVPSCEVR